MSHFWFRPVRALEMSLLDRLTRTLGVIAAAMAMAPQARTEKTVEKRIMIERLRKRR